MISDKEIARWDEPILANSPEEAQKECQKRGERYGVELESITRPRKMELRPQIYRCNYREQE
jgi:hypothetical protein